MRDYVSLCLGVAVLLQVVAALVMLFALRWIRSRIQWAALFFSVCGFLLMDLWAFIDHRFSRMDGPFDLELCIASLIMSTGAIAGVTVLIRVIRRQQDRDDASRAMTQRYEQLFRDNDLPMIVMDSASGTVLEANAMASRLSQLPCESIAGMNIEELGCEPGIRAKVAQADAEGRGQVEARHVSPSGVMSDLVIHQTAVDGDGKRLTYCIIEDVTERNAARRELIEQQERLAYLAQHDPLTKLANRRVLDTALDKAVARARRGTPGALLFVDIDHFKAINDDRGHDAGDAVLVRIADILVESVRTEDIVARTGGDEFAVLLEMTEPADALSLAQRLVQTVREQVDGVGVSIGIANLTPTSEPGHVMRLADLCMYQAKDAGGGTVVTNGGQARNLRRSIMT